MMKSAPVVDLAQWRIDHPPVFTFITASWYFWMAMHTAFVTAGTRQAAAILKFKPRSYESCSNPRKRL